MLGLIFLAFCALAALSPVSLTTSPSLYASFCINFRSQYQYPIKISGKSDVFKLDSVQTRRICLRGGDSDDKVNEGNIEKPQKESQEVQKKEEEMEEFEMEAINNRLWQGRDYFQEYDAKSQERMDEIEAALDLRAAQSKVEKKEATPLGAVRQLEEDGSRYKVPETLEEELSFLVDLQQQFQATHAGAGAQSRAQSRTHTQHARTRLTCRAPRAR